MTGKPEAKLHDARLTQLCFFMLTRVPVIVLNLEDIRRLSAAGSFPLLLHQKAHEIESSPTRAPTLEPCGAEVELPPHLRELD